MSREQDFMTTFEAVFDVHPDAVFLQTRDGAIVDCNPAAGNLTGYGREELLSLRRDTLFGEDLSDVVAGLFDGDNPSCSLSGTCFGRNGACIPATIDMRVFSMDGAPFVFVAVRDNSERVRTLEEIGRLERRLRQSEKLEVIGRLAGGISHLLQQHLHRHTRRTRHGQAGCLLRHAAAAPSRGEGREHGNPASRGGCSPSPAKPAKLSNPRTSPFRRRYVVDFARTTFDRRIEIEARRAGDLDAVLGDIPPSSITCFESARERPRRPPRQISLR
jgi:PAS domain S-box-containing protein